MSSSRPLLSLLLLTSTLLALPCRAMQLDEQLGSDATAETVAPESTAQPDTVDTEREAITDYLRANIGEPYQLGATGGSDGFDCSGLVLRAYAAAGLAVPRVSADQFHVGSAVALAKLRAGDLLFYRMRGESSRRLHVVVYIGDGRAIHASVLHNAVREIDITSKVWSKHLVAARSLL